MKKLFLLFFAILPLFATGQVIPSGLGDINNASWMALGIKQDLDTLDLGWSSTTYIANGRMSNPDNHNPFYKQGIFVLNQEFKHHFSKNWAYSLALSYRNQNRYSKTYPYGKADPAGRQELRLYGRFSYIFHTPFVTITPTFRQEFQKYYTPDFKDYPETFRLRSRFRLKFMFPLTSDKRHRLLLYSEQLFSTSLMRDTKDWTTFGYKDSRFAIYYSLSPENIPFTFDLGYMNDLIGKKDPTSSSYFAIDIIWKNPFS